MSEILTELQIDQRFRGPDHSANGGYVCGLLARHVPGACRVRLSAPPPLDRPLRLMRLDDGSLQLLDGDSLIASARADTLEPDLPPAPPMDQVRRASGRYRGFTRHSFPRCFVCGPERQGGDGLHIFPGPDDDSGRVMAPWTPDDSLADGEQVSPEFLWAALDCPSGFAVWPDDSALTIVLGEFRAQLAGHIAPGESCRIVAWPLGQDGRKRHAASVLFGENDQPVAWAQATWIEVAASRFAAA